MALLYFKSPHQVHPLIAKVWSQRFPGYVVVAANEDFIPGTVSLSVRSVPGVDLTAFLAALFKEGKELGCDHGVETGGILDKVAFARLLQGLGFKGELRASA